MIRRGRGEEESLAVGQGGLGSIRKSLVGCSFRCR